MWQKVPTVPARLAVLLLLTAVFLVQKPYLGEFQPQSSVPADLNAASNDPTIEDLFERDFEEGKMFAAVQSPRPKRTPEPTPKPILVASQTYFKPTPVAISAPIDIDSLVRKYAAEYGANAEIMLIIAKCESGFRPDAISPSGAYHGMYQFVPSTWRSNRRAMGLSENTELMYNAEEAIKTAAFKMGRDGYGAWPACAKKAYSQLSLAN